MSRFHIYVYGPDAGPLETSFEASETRLRQLDRLFFEPDGSFVWRDGCNQVDGMLYDSSGELQYVELRGDCSRETWRCVLVAIAGDRLESCTLMRLPNRQVQNLQSFEESVWLDESID